MLINKDSAVEPTVLIGSGAPPANMNDIVKRAAHAGKALIVRQALVYGANILGSVILARLLPPDQYGYYGIALFAVAFLGIFGGTGFAANLIRTHEEPSIEEMRVLFTAQQLMVGVLFAALWFTAPYLASIYKMPEHSRWFFRMIGGALALTSMMVMPQIRMERKLAFDKLAVVEICQALAFNISAVLLAWKGAGVLSFSAALMIRATVGAILAHGYMPWSMGFKWNPSLLFRHLHFGVALQAGQFVSMLKDSISPLFVGMFLGAADVGYATWASSLAAYAVWILMPMQRLYLPFFARLQHDRNQLRKVVSFTLWMANTVAAPLTVITLALSRPITALIFGDKWLVALPLLVLFSIGNLFVPCSTPLLGVLNALGESKTTLAIALMWMMATWFFGVPCIMMFGINGFGMALLGVQLTNLVLYWIVWRKLAVSPLPTFWPSWPLAACIGAVLFLVQRALPIHNMLALGCYGLIGIVAYSYALWLGCREKIISVTLLMRG